MSELKPVHLERRILPKVWGGRALETVLGISLPGEGAIGETWEVYDRPDGSSRLRDSDETLRDLMRHSPDDLLGRRVRPVAGGYFPLLVKLIDARTVLSVQVHPNDEQARIEGDGGKSEAWVVLHAGPDARIIRGIRGGVSQEQFAAVAHTGAVEELLWSFRPEVGDCVHVPAGTVHALGPDVVVFEVQQNSDVTYRLYDWGRPRQTHVERALSVVRLGTEEQGDHPTVAPRAIEEGAEWLVEDEHFRVRRFRFGSVGTLGTEGTFKILSVINGKGTLGWHSGGEDPPLLLTPGDTVLVPACVGVVFLSPVGLMDVLWSDPGEGD